ncbi:MAG: ABC transporter ATP-binding protein [Thermoprotei archaeon]|nr:MAG: ABC transporter ATP-binding protein [Thermoprotei archaeon]
MNVTKFYRYGILGIPFPAVDNVTLAFTETPTIFTLAGESGCGKSTLAKIIAGIVRPDRGAVLYRGKNLWKLNKQERLRFRKEVQIILQDPYETFNPFEKVDNYLERTAVRIGGVPKDKSEEYIAKILNFVGLDYHDVVNKKPHEFSGGQLQRVSIARALLANPKFLIADEPVSMIDASLRVEILNLFKRIKEERKVSILYITHDLATAYYITDKLAIMYRGSIVEEGDVETIVNKPHHPYTQLLISSLPDYRKGREWLYEEVKITSIEVKEFLFAGCKFHDRCPYAMDICKSRIPPRVEVEPGHFVLCWLHAKK